jgi:beta-1,4-mannooligosaccharide/beta-1,4-mannosyl-N-acetylglucosamine phosphorylase
VPSTFIPFDRNRPKEIVRRYEGNPILTAADFSGDIWVSFSPDLSHWGGSRCVVARDDFRWCSHKIGPGAVPIRTDDGWLTIFHGVRTQCAQHYVYQLGVILLDLEDPSKVVAKSERAILIPQRDYELTGQTPSVVFSNAAIAEPDGTVRIYYGATDSVQCVAFSTIQELLAACRNV